MTIMEQKHTQNEQSLKQSSSWSELPRKSQLFLLFLCRLFDFTHIAIFQTICYYQLKSFDSSVPETTLSWQTGIAIGAFTAAQICTSVLWGICADKKWCGRKPVLLIGLFGTAISCVGSAFSHSFHQMVLFRVLAGLLNGTVGVVRTMLSEFIVEKRFQSRAFSLLSLSFNVASLFGPLIAGFLSNPLEVDTAVQKSHWWQRYPYALPSLVSAGLMFLLGIIVSVYTMETAKNLQSKEKFRKKSRACILRLGRQLGFLRIQNNRPFIEESLQEDEDAAELLEANRFLSNNDMDSEWRRPLEVRSSPVSTNGIWTFSFLMTLCSQAFFDLHMGAFTALWPLFLSSPRTQDPIGHDGVGLGMPIRGVGVATSTLGAIGMIVQIFIYPRIHDLMGTVKTYRLFSVLFPIAYSTFPLIRTIHIDVGIWFFIVCVLLIHVTGRVFVIPATIMVLNNSAPHPTLLGKVHGIGQTISAVFRTLGPFLAGYLYRGGLKLETAIFPWWTVAGIGILGFGAAQFVRDGNVPTAPMTDED